MCKKFASERKMIVKFLFALVAAMCFVPSFADDYGIVKPTGAPAIYSGDSVALVYGAKATEPGIFVYSLAEDGTYLSKIPKALLPDVYYVWYKFIPEDTKKPETEPSSVKVTISPKQLQVVWSDTSDVVYDGNYHKPTTALDGIVGDDKVEASVEQFRDAGTYIITAVLTGDHSERYKLEIGRAHV